MADVLVNNNVSAVEFRSSPRSQVWVTSQVGYQFYVEHTSKDLIYKKSTNGGTTWGDEVTIHTGTVVQAFDVWFDKWTPGDSGTKIHIWLVDSGTDDPTYYNLDTADDSVSAGVAIFDGATTGAGGIGVTGAKMRGGNLLCVFDIDGGTEDGCYRSTDGGANWTVRADPSEGADYWLLFPGNESDNQDAWLVYVDRSANEISLKTYDDSADSWSEQAIQAIVDQAQDTVGAGYAGAIRHSDRHLILVFASDRDTATADLKVYDINGAASIAALTDVITDKDDFYNPTIAINQNNDHLYVAYNGKADGSETIGTSSTAFYVRSPDGGTTWGSETAYAASAYAVSALPSSLGGLDSRFAPVIFDGGNLDIYINVDNSVVFGPTPGAGGRGFARRRRRPYGVH